MLSTLSAWVILIPFSVTGVRPGAGASTPPAGPPILLSGQSNVASQAADTKAFAVMPLASAAESNSSTTSVLIMIRLVLAGQLARVSAAGRIRS